MLTAAMVVEILKSSWVTCRAQPPFWIRLGARLNDAQYCGMPLTSVGGGLRKAGSLLARFGSCGPGSLSAFGLTTLTAPSGGSSGLPNEAASAADAAATTAPVALAASKLRRERDLRFFMMGLLIGAPATEVAVARLMLTAGCGS